MEIPDKTGYSPRRHQLYIDLMILKKSRNFLLSKQRTLGLLYSEFNHSNGRMGKNLMDRALSRGCIAPDQYCRPNRSGIEHALNWCLTFDHQFYTWCPFCLGCCDLTGCYDRILHTIAALVLRKVWGSKAKNHSMFSEILKILMAATILVPTIRYLSCKGVIMMFSLVVVGASPIGGIGISQR